MVPGMKRDTDSEEAVGCGAERSAWVFVKTLLQEGEQVGSQGGRNLFPSWFGLHHLSKR